MTVLIVDQDPTTRTWLQHILCCETRTAATPREGVYEAGSWQPSVIVVDGDDCDDDDVRLLKRACPRAQIIVMTSRYRRGREKVVLDLDVFSYAEKGDADLLRSLVSTARRLVGSLVVPSGAVH